MTQRAVVRASLLAALLAFAACFARAPWEEAPPAALALVATHGRRFRRVFEALREADAETWTEAAQAAGYFDHPQMARDFRRFVGCTPSQFVAAGQGLSASLVDLTA